MSKRYFITRNLPANLDIYNDSFVDDMHKFIGYEVFVEPMGSRGIIKIILVDDRYQFNEGHTGFWIHDNNECRVIEEMEVVELPEDLFEL